MKTINRKGLFCSATEVNKRHGLCGRSDVHNIVAGRCYFHLQYSLYLDGVLIDAVAQQWKIQGSVGEMSAI